MSRCRRSLHWFLVLLTVCLLGLSPAFGETLREEFSRTFRLDTGGDVSIRNTNGNLDFSTWERAEVLIEATKVVKAMGRSRAQDVLEQVEIEIDHSNGSLTVKTILPESKGALSWLFGRGVDAKVSYRVTLPRLVELDAHTVNGNVNVDSVTGTIDARTTNGQIRITDAAGKAIARTTNGNIRAEFRKIESGSNCDFRTTNGGITVWVPETLGADVEASTVNGAVNTDFSILADASGDRWRRKRLTGEINGGGGQLSLHTVNGSIQLRKTEQ